MKNPKKDRDVPPAPSVSSGNAPKSPMISKVVPSNTSNSRNVKRKDMPTSSPSLTYVPLSRILRPMPNEDVLHPFAPGSVAWDELWLEQDNGKALRVFTTFHRDKEQSAVQSCG